MTRARASAEPLSDKNYRTLAEFRHEIRRFIVARARAARDAGIDPQQYQVLLILKARGKGQPPSIGEIAESMLLRHHSVVELLDRMASNKLVRRQRSRDDRRVVGVTLLPRGEAALRSLSISNREELTGLLRELLKALEAALAS